MNHLVALALASIIILPQVACSSSPIDDDYDDTPTPTGHCVTTTPTSPGPTPTPTSLPSPTPTTYQNAGGYPQGLWDIDPVGAWWSEDSGVAGVTWTFSGTVTGTSPGSDWGEAAWVIRVWGTKEAYDTAEPPACAIPVDASGYAIDVPEGCPGCLYAHRFALQESVVVPPECPTSDYLEEWIRGLGGHTQGYRPGLSSEEAGAQQAVFTDLAEPGVFSWTHTPMELIPLTQIYPKPTAR